MRKPRPLPNSGIPLRDPRDRSFLGPLPLDPVVPPYAVIPPPQHRRARQERRGPTDDQIVAPKERPRQDEER